MLSLNSFRLPWMEDIYDGRKDRESVWEGCSNKVIGGRG